MNDFILNLFTGTDENRPAMMFPNLANGFVCATDTRDIIAIPENELSFKYGTSEKYPNAQKIIDDFSSKELKSVRVNVNDLSKQLAKARIEVDKDSIKCKECSGNGSVQFEYEDKSGETHYEDCQCPVCNGKGSSEKTSKFARINLNMIEDEDGLMFGIDIYNKLYFHPFQLYRLFLVATLKKVDEFDIFYDPKSYGTVISFFGNIKVLTMLMIRPS